MKRLYGTLPNFTIKGKEDKPSDGLEISILAFVLQKNCWDGEI